MRQLAAGSTFAGQLCRAVQLGLHQLHVGDVVQVFSNANVGVAQVHQFDLLSIGTRTQNEPDGRLLARSAVVFIEPAQVQLHLPLVCRLKRFQLQLYRHQSAQVPVIKQQVEVKIIRSDRDALLPRHKGEASAEFEINCRTSDTTISSSGKTSEN